MGNAGLRHFVQSYETWVTNHSILFNTYIPGKIKRLVRKLLSNKPIAAIVSIDGGARFMTRKVVITGRGTAIYSENEFIMRYEGADIRFDGTWHLELPYNYVSVFHGRNFTFTPLWYVGRLPTPSQIDDLRVVPFETPSRYAHETTSEYETRMVSRPSKVKYRPEPAAEQELICKICFVHKPSEVIIPCGHTICPTCEADWKASTCPFCRSNIKDTVHIFY